MAKQRWVGRQSLTGDDFGSETKWPVVCGPYPTCKEVQAELSRRLPSLSCCPVIVNKLRAGERMVKHKNYIP